MEFLEAKKKHEDLVRLIEKYSHEYYVLDNPTVSDFEYDQKMEELQRLEEEFPELITKTSPTQRIIGQVLDGFEEIHHEKQMLSLGDVFNDEELLDWVKKTEESAHKELEFVAEMKIDGLAMSLVYQDGVLKYAATRGDGMTGEDVTTNVLTIPSVPTRINLMGRVEVRGEIYMPKKSFAELNEARKEKGEPLFANARNAAAGSIRNLDSSVARSRKLDGWWYYFANAEDFGIKTHAEAINKLDELAKLGEPRILLDAQSQNQIGGTGTQIDEELLSLASKKYKLWIAGGINSENVNHLISNFHPQLIDVSSSLEIEPGIKSEEKIKVFCQQFIDKKINYLYNYQRN